MKRDGADDALSIAVALASTTGAYSAWLLMGPSMERALAVSGSTIVGAIAVALIRSRGRVLVSPTVLGSISLGIIFWLRPYIDLQQSDTSYQLGLPIGGRYAQAIELGALGIAAFGLAIAMPYKVSERSRPAAIEEPPMPLVRSVALGTIGLSAVALALFLAQGGTQVLFAGREQAAIDFLQASNGYLYTAPLWVFPIGLYLYGRGLKEQRRDTKVWGLITMAGSQVVSFGLGDRSFFLVALLAAFWVRCVVLRRQPRPLVALLLIPILLFVGIVLPREARTAESFSAAVNASVDASTDWYAPFLGEDFAMARNLALVLYVVPEQTGYAWGETYAAALARPIPRALLPSKPEDADAQLNEAAVYQFQDIQAGFSYSAFSEPYYNFGLLGVGAFGFVAGRLLRRFDAWAFSPSRSLIGISIAGSIFGLTLVMVRGNLGTNVQRVAFYTGAVLLLAWLTHRRNRGKDS